MCAKVSVVSFSTAIPTFLPTINHLKKRSAVLKTLGQNVTDGKMFGCTDPGRHNRYKQIHTLIQYQYTRKLICRICVDIYKGLCIFMIVQHIYIYIYMSCIYIHIQSTSKVNHLMLPVGACM